ncbi:MAG TPA: membrane protein insertase YidC [Xanthobacteraceae bacterium]|nr:membrane protein insertase YidC [Xanthobacteraceae bacterium]
MQQDQKNTILAIVLSALVLVVWQYFVGWPQMEKQRLEAQQKAQQQQQQQQQASGPAIQAPQPSQTGTGPQAPGQIGAATAGQQMSRTAAIAAAGSRIKIETAKLQGSIALKGGRIDDLALVQYRETVDPKSPAIILLSPAGSPHPFYAEFGWVAATGSNVKVPTAETVWRQEGGSTLTVGQPVKLVWENGEGLEFRRTIAVDENYLFTVQDEVINKSAAPVSLYPYALISRHGTPPTLGYYILHEGLIGVIDDKLQEFTYSDVEKKKIEVFNKTSNAWLGITDKYWAATLIPDPKAKIDARFMATNNGSLKTYQSDYLGEGQTIAPGATATTGTRLFAGAKEVAIIDGYERQYNINKFELLIDWGWFYFVTKPMFWAIDFLFRWLGNFGLAILAVTVIIKIIFFPLANKSYASMAKMKAVQPQMMAIRERYPDDKVKQQQELMELYKREKINPVAGCLPIVIQIPVFFALYKVLFITIEMRHAPFYGWIKDLSAPDPTNIFNLFGLIPWDPTVIPVLGPFLHVGVWPLIMGVTMWVQMKLNPPPPDPAQKVLFDWMPVLFTFMLASFSAGLVIYWAWNNFLSIIQQSVIMRKHGAKIELWDNLKEMFSRKKTT